MKAYYESHPEYKERVRQRRPHRRRWVVMRGLISESEVARRLNDSSGCCEICGREARLVIDHDHDTDAVRGLLCYSCNVLLGVAHDDPTVLIAAIEYLRKHPQLLAH